MALSERAAGGGGALVVMAIGVPALAVLPQLHKTQESDMDTLRLQEMVFAGIVVVSGLIASAGIDSTIPFGVAVLFTFVIIALYEFKAQGGMK